ncbi:MAG: translocation/assembly module TamB domain-containing protein [Alphaproteobacteria bacterium]
MVKQKIRIVVMSFCRVALSCFSFAITMVMFAPLFIGDVYYFLNSDNTREVLESYIENKASDSVYVVDIQGLDYDLASGSINIDIVDIYHSLQPSLRMSSISFNISVESLIFGDINLNSNIKKLVIENQNAHNSPFVFSNVSTSIQGGISDFISGTLKANAAFKDRNLGLSSKFLMDRGVLKLSDLSFYAPELNGRGAVDVHMAGGLLRGKISGELKSLSFYESFIGNDHSLSDAEINLTFTHDTGKQNIVTKARVKSYSNRDSSISLNDIGVDAVLSGRNITLNSFVAGNPDGGDIHAAGKYNLINSSADFSLKLNDFYVSHMDMAKGVINAYLNLKGSDLSYLISGDVVVDNMNIDIPDKFSQSTGDLNIETVVDSDNGGRQGNAQSINLDIDVNAPKQVFVRGWGIDAEFNGKVKVSGDVNNPEFDGDIKLMRGRYSEFGKEFKLSKASLMFSGTIPPTPDLDIVAETKTEEILAKIGIKGKALEPVIEFSSVPPLPKDEVLAHILFGEGVENISPFQAVKLAQTLQRFTGYGGGAASGFDPVDMIRNATGLDDLHFGTDKDGNATIGAGKHLSDKVYVEVEAGSETGAGKANIEIELTPNITLESEIGQNAQGGAGVFWKWDY